MLSHNMIKTKFIEKKNNFIRQVEQSPKIANAIARMDNFIQFMTKQKYVSGNPVITAVRTPLVIGLWVMLIISSITLVWGAFAPIESAAIAKGNVVLLSNKKSIQHLEGGVIKQILVREGDKVEAGQQLIILNDTAATASRDILQGQLYIARAGEARLTALLSKSEQISFDEDMVESSKTDENLAKAMNVQLQLFESARDTHKTKLSILEQRILQSQKEIEGLNSQIKSASEQIIIDNKEISSTKALIQKGFDTNTRLFKLQRHLNELQGNLGQYEADVAKVGQSISELQMQIINQQNDFETKSSQELRDVQSQISDLSDKLRQAKDVVSRTIITSPSGGIITGLKYHTSGGVLTPGAHIMDIIPQDDLLVIEAHLKPNDISVIHEGLDARVIFTAYKMRTTPKIPGKVTQVSADTFSDERNPAAPYYTARIEVDKNFINNMAHPIELYPGMPTEVLINTGSRSFLGYLFKPVTDSMNIAFREK